MRRFLLLLTSLAILVLVFGTVGCGGDDEEATPTPPPSSGAPMTLTAIAEAIRSGDIDVGTESGMGVDQRYHKIHATVLGLDCTLCHKAAAGVAQDVFADQDVSDQSPTPVDAVLCVGCHSAGGPAQTLYE